MENINLEADIPPERRVLIFSLLYLPKYVGGAEIAVREITNRIPGTATAFDMIALRLDATEHAFERMGAVDVHRVGGALTSFLSRIGAPILAKYTYPFLACARAIRLSRLNSYDLTWSIMANYAGFAALFFSWMRPRIPLLLTLQEGDPIPHILRRANLVMPLFRRIFTRAAYIQTISKYLADFAGDMGARSTIEVVPNGVDLDRFGVIPSANEIAETRQNLGITDGQYMMITVSRLVEKNAVDLCIKSLTHLGMDVFLVIAGRGPLEGSLRALARTEGVESRVRFAGEVTHADLPRLLASSDVFVRPSRSEGLGNAFLEAMCARVPVVATSVGGIADFLHGVRIAADKTALPPRDPNGFAVPVDDPSAIAFAVKRILADESLRGEIVRNAERLVREKYGWDGIAKSLRRIMETVVGDIAKRRVLVATGAFPPAIGGPATYSALLAKALPEYGFAVDVSIFDRVRRHLWGLRHFYYALELFSRSRGVEIVFAQDPVSVGFPACIVSIFLGKIFVVKVVGDYAWEQGVLRFGVTEDIKAFQRIRSNRFQVRLFRAVERFVARRARRVIVPCRFLAKIVTQWGVIPDRIWVIPNAIDELPKLSSRQELRAKYALRDFTVIAAGRFVPWKGFHDLIVAVAKLRTRNVPVVLYFAGDGPERVSLENEASSRGLGSAVTFAGRLAKEELYARVKAADIMALPSGYEGFSHQILEAMALGTPVVTTGEGGNLEIIEDGKNAVIAPYRNPDALAAAIESLYKDRLLRERLAAEGLQTAAMFTSDRTVKTLADVLKGV